MTQSCPYCQRAISAPTMNQYHDYFFCQHCQGALSHHEMDIMLYALIFLLLCSGLLNLVFGINSLVAMGLSMLAYHIIRPKFLESYFRLRIVDLVQHT